jgi:hypothetical protein
MFVQSACVFHRAVYMYCISIGVERLYCKSPIQSKASSEILTPPLPHRPASVYPSSEDARHCSVLYICI